MKKVVILGGGVAGMSAAHELMERGFDVEVYELRSIPGGKARSYSVARTARPGRPGFPAEHGFRFFPRFYRHLPDTMKRIPYPGNRRGVYDNLVEATRLEFCRENLPPFIVSARFPITPDDWKVVIGDLLHPTVQVSEEERHFFGERFWQLLTSCYERRIDEYERICWWDFVGAETRSKTYQEFFAHGLTRSLVAAKAHEASTKTIGDIFLQLFFDMVYPGISSDRLLNGPTNDVWIEPWLKYLNNPPPPLKPITYLTDAEVVSINCGDGVIQSATINHNGQRFDVTGDYYIAAFPIEVMATHITDDMLKIDPSMADIQTLAANVNSMVGIQFYLKEDVEITHGHVAYVTTPWSLTSISQHQFWNKIDLSRYGDGQVKGVLSADISEWDKKGILNWAKPGDPPQYLTAEECTPEQIKDETWAQMKGCLNVDGQEILKDDNLLDWNLEMDVVPDPNHPGKKMNREPLLVNYICTWDKRPDAFSLIPNLFLASDYVQTNTDIACMEAANEAARRAVNRILADAGVQAPPCKIWKLREPWIFWFWRRHDLSRYEQDLPWNGKLWG
jgi:uncharacterized protein with NAD-binding domain and iron-sulfur cluster